jgi:TolB protein
LPTVKSTTAVIILLVLDRIAGAQAPAVINCGASWSPSGARVAFHSDRQHAGVMSVFTMDTLGGGVRALFDDSLYSAQPAWSPDGKTLAISRGSAKGDRYIFLVDPDGRNLRQLTQGSGVASWPAWSADGKTIIFDWETEGNLDIYRIASSGGAPTRLTTDAGRDNLAKWSAKDSTIVFDSKRSGRWQVFSMNADGSNQRAIVDGAVPIFSRSAEWLLYQTSPVPQATNLFLMKPDGSNARQLTTGNHSEANATFGPGDASIIFCSNRSGSYELYRMLLAAPDHWVQLTGKIRP